METEGETELAADVSATKSQTNAAIESSGAEDDDHEGEDLPSVQFAKSLFFKRLIQASVMVSAISVGMNTRKTFEKHGELWYLTLILDILVLVLLMIESFMDMKILGLWKGNLAFFRNRVKLFNLAMLIFIALSVVLQIIVKGHSNNSSAIPEFVRILVRAPRALILLRVMKYFMNYSLLRQVSRRSGKQIRNVAIFLLYFMIFASLVGVQLFGGDSFYCVKPGTKVDNVTYKDLTLPDIRCHKENRDTCPPNFVCSDLKLSFKQRTPAHFKNIWYSFLTVYESSTQEGWVLVMYAEMNRTNYFVSAIYFVSLIFFVAWLVKSVFIAVITETFADLRSQLYLKNWRTNRRVTGLSSEIIQDDGITGWHLVAIKEEWTKIKAFNRARRFLTSKYFRFMIWTLLAAEAVSQASVFKAKHTVRLVFTIIFDLESLFKIWCVGLKSYWKIPVYRFELFLAVGSSLCMIVPVTQGHHVLAAFQILRVTRLIIAVPSLHAFLYKAFGSGTKIGAVVIFTLFFLVFTSILSLQLFSGMDFKEETNPFGDFLRSSSSMFQIITQEGWVEVLNTVKYASCEQIAPFISIYFTIYNLFASLILGSVFIAVILDNLEIKEETKILKQRKLDEEVLNIQETLPRRLRVFEKFKERPRLVETRKVSAEFHVPKVRQSFMRRFLDDSRTRLLQLTRRNPSVYEDALLTQCRDLPFKLLSSPGPDDIHTLRLKKRSSLTQLIQDSTRRRNLGEHGKYTRHSAKSYVLGYTARQINRNAAKLTQSALKSTELADMNALTRMRSPREITQATLPHSTSARGTEDWNIRELRARREQAQRVKAAHEESLRENHPYFDFPLFLVSRDSGARQWLQRIVHARYESLGMYGEVQSKRPMFNDAWIKRVLSTQTYLEWMIILITFCSCLAMMFEKPNVTARGVNVTAFIFFEYLFVVATSVELVIRILADGLLFTPCAVIRDVGDIIDISIYLIGFIYLCWLPVLIQPNSAAWILLILRALRPLRIINLIPKMRQVIQELFGGFKEILKVATLQLSLMFIFASYGVQMFSGKLVKCNDARKETANTCRDAFFITLKGPHELRELAGDENQILVPRVWMNPKNFHFDDTLAALLALFEALSLEGWLDIRNVIERSLDTFFGFYIHAYVLVGCMIGLALFVGVVVNNFNEKKGTALLTVDQRRWEDLRKRLRLAQPLHLPLRPDDSAIRSTLYDLTQSSHYQRFIVCLVVLNCGTLAGAPWSVDPNSILTIVLMLISVVFTILFVVDCILKIIAVTFMGYWRSFRNRFDFILTLAGIFWIIFYFVFVFQDEQEYKPNITVWLGVVIILFRFLSLSGKHDTLKMLMMTVSMSLVKSFYIIFVLLLIMLSYALVGVIMFGTVKYGVAIDNKANFKWSISAMFLLFRITTGEDWNKIMHDCMIEAPYCTEAAEGENYWETDCGSKLGALCYFISFYVIITFIFLNLLIAVIIENFSLFYSSEEDAALSNHDLYQYQLTWNVVDQNRKGFITVRQARLILRLLRGRLGVDPSSFLYKHICLEIEKLRGGREVSFHDLLEILAYRSIDDISRSLQLEDLLAREELERSIEEEVAIQTIRNWFLSLKKEKVKTSRSFSFGASSASSVERSSSDSEEEQPNRLSVKPFQKRSVNSKSATPTITVSAEIDKTEDKGPNEKKDKELGAKLKDQSTLDSWFTEQLTS